MVDNSSWAFPGSKQTGTFSWRSAAWRSNRRLNDIRLHPSAVALDPRFCGGTGVTYYTLGRLVRLPIIAYRHGFNVGPKRWNWAADIILEANPA